MGEIFGRGLAYGLDTDRGDDWTKQAACRDQDGELWFPLGGLNGQRRSGANLDQEEYAKSICNGRCPVRDKCRAESLERGDEFGIFGGLNEAERRAIREGRLAPVAKPRWCQRCSTQFAFNPRYPHARICPPCAHADAVKHRKRRPSAVPA